MLYTHGYLIDFERGAKRAALFQENYGLEGRLVWFTWPSDGNALEYAGDETDMAWSVPHLAETLKHMGERFGWGNFDVVGHSLGTRGVVAALLEAQKSGLGQVVEGHSESLVFLLPVGQLVVGFVAVLEVAIQRRVERDLHLVNGNAVRFELDQTIEAAPHRFTGLAEEAYHQIERVYAAAGVPERLDLDIFETGHRYNGAKAFDWFRRWLLDG